MQWLKMSTVVSRMRSPLILWVEHYGRLAHTASLLRIDNEYEV